MTAPSSPSSRLRAAETARAPGGLLLEEVRPVGLAPADLAGAGDPVPLRRTSVGLHLGHQVAPDSGATAGAGSATDALSGGAAGRGRRGTPALAPPELC